MSNRISLILYLVSIFIFFTSISCVKNETPENCLGDIIKDTTNSFCNAGACVSVVKGDFTISEKSQKMLLAMCDKEGTIYIFKNDKGDLKELKLKQKFNTEINVEFSSLLDCPADKRQPISYCCKIQSMGLTLTETKSDVELVIIISTEPDISQPPGKLGDFLTVLRGNASSFGYTEELKIIIDQKSLSNDMVLDQEFYPSLKIGALEYKAVHSMDVTGFMGGVNKYYINEDKGLIAFKDEDEILWIRK